jgi:hypothetical protein
MGFSIKIKSFYCLSDNSQGFSNYKVSIFLKSSELRVTNVSPSAIAVAAIIASGNLILCPIVQVLHYAIPKFLFA